MGVVGSDLNEKNMPLLERILELSYCIWHLYIQLPEGNSMTILADLPENLLQFWLVQVCSLVTHCMGSWSAARVFFFCFFFLRKKLSALQLEENSMVGLKPHLYPGHLRSLTFTAWGGNLLLWKCQLSALVQPHWLVQTHNQWKFVILVIIT